MIVDEITSPDVNTNGGGETPPSAGLTSNALPETQRLVAESSQTGVSTRSASSSTEFQPNSQDDSLHWYALRTTYGREKKAYDYLVAKGIKAFFPTKSVIKLINGKRKKVIVSRLPNIFFAYGTEDQIKTYVYDNINLPFLRFYYCHQHIGSRIVKFPMIVPDYQMDSLRIICEAEAEDTIVSADVISKFKNGQLVRITDGYFKGTVGRVARYKGQQRVGVVVGDMLTICTAYVPSVCLEIIE